MATAEAKVMDLLTQHNKPFNAQSVADFLAPQARMHAALFDPAGSFAGRP